MIRVYGTTWCGDCKRAKKFFGEHRVPYEWVDIDRDTEGQRIVIEASNGKRIIPTIFFDDGSVLIEPSNVELARQLGLNAAAVLLAPGSTYRRLGVPGEEDFIGAGVHFCATCDGAFYRDQEVLVIGGGIQRGGGGGLRHPLRRQGHHPGARAAADGKRRRHRESQGKPQNLAVVRG